jgi:hypothetical protein
MDYGYPNRWVSKWITGSQMDYGYPNGLSNGCPNGLLITQMDYGLSKRISDYQIDFIKARNKQ